MKFKFITLILLCSLTGFTQTREAINNLHERLRMAKDDTSRINANMELCLLHRLGNTDSSLLYGQTALTMAQRIGYLPGQIETLGFMCIATEQQGNLPKSLELGFKALQLAQEYKMENWTGPALDGIAEVYIILKDYATAISYLRKYISMKENSDEDEGLAYAYFDTGVAYVGVNQLDSALIYEEKAIATFQKYNYEEPLVYQTIGDIQLKSGNAAAALRYYQESLQISLKKNERRASSYAYNKIASFYKSVHEPDSAIFYSLKGLEESRSIAQKKTIMEAAAQLSDLFEPTDTKESLRYLKIADAYKDSLFGAGNLQAVQSLVTQQEERQQQVQEAKKLYRTQLKQYLLIAGLLVLLLTAFFLSRNNRKERRAKNLLQSKNQLIQETLDNLKSTQAQLIQSEKMASLGELTAGIAHEIQNPLNFVNNFSEVNRELLEELKHELATGNRQLATELATDISANSEKINQHGKRAGAIVKGMLQHSRTNTGQKEPTDINAVAEEYLRLAYHGLRAKDKSFNVALKTDLDPAISKINVVPQDIGRVLLNLINNAFYAVSEKKKLQPDNYEPTIAIRTKKTGNKVEIAVSDNGIGIPASLVDKIFQPFFTTKPTGEGTGLGLSLSYDIVKAHNGELAVTKGPNDETVFVISLPA